MILHTAGLFDTELTLDYAIENQELQTICQRREKAILKYQKFYRFPIYGNYLREKMHKLRKLHEAQFRKTRVIYQKSDEHKRTTV